MILIRLLFSAALFTLATWTAHGQIVTYQEEDGIVVVEAESFIDFTNSQWRIDTNIQGFTGAGYAIYIGPDRFNNQNGRTFAFDVAFAKTGTYRVEWRSRIAVGSSISEHNDSWLRVNRGRQTFAERGGSVLYPKGTGQSPVPEGSGANGWYKAYQNNLGNWTYNTRTSDNDPHEIYLTVDAPGSYRIEVSGRSNGHAIDRVTLFHSDITVTSARNPNLPQSNTTVSDSKEASPLDRAELFPNPADSQFTLRSDALRAGQTYTAEVVDAQGKVLTAQRLLASSNQLEVDVQQLAVGIYFVRVVELEGMQQVRLVRR